MGKQETKKNELRNALSHSLPGFLEVTDFSIEALQNFGNDVDPKYSSRFKATVESSASLYKIENKVNNATIVRLITPKGKETDIFGRTNSILYQGAWKHNIKLDGNPIHNLGIPINQSYASRVIIQGSYEEKAFYAKIEQEKKELRQKKYERSC